MALAPAGRFAALLSDLKAAVGSAYAIAGASQDEPAVRLQTGLRATWDCADCCWIVLQGILPSARVGNAERCLLIPDLIVTLDVARCWPTPDDGGAVDPAAEEKAALQIARDAEILWYGLGALRQSGELFPSFQGLDCDAVPLGQMIPVGPLGALAGFSWRIDVHLVAGLRPEP